MSVNQQRLLDEFLELVQIDAATKNERQIADVLKTKLKDLGLAVTEDDAGEKIGGNTGNIIAVLEGELDTTPLLFCAHMDRVEPGSGIKPKISDGIITSDGTTILAADDVTGLAAILEGLRVVKEEKIPHGRIEILFTVAEEGGLFGAKSLDHTKLQAQAGYFLDSDGPVGTIIVQAPAQKGIEITVHGKAAHAGVAPETGINAIVVAAHAITKMNLGRLDMETTANIGIIKGGGATNIVPDKVKLWGEARSRDDAKLDKQIEHMAETVRKVCTDYGVTADIEIEDSYRSFSLNQDDYVVKLACQAAEAMGVEPHFESTGGGSDANIINAYGIPSVVLGVGYANVHTTSERMPIDELVKAAEYVVSIIKVS
ncbi:MAG TPA: M20/M25/M40 family metallo-hydrolase [Firmicutes bacterium]|nr:M20/M25/M40 family metallo-hydrolase [Bacillota bacterium]